MGTVPPPPPPAPLTRSSSTLGEDECPVCSALLYNPVTLHCGHTCCQRCLALWVVSSAGQKKCPVGCGAQLHGWPHVSIVLKKQIEERWRDQVRVRSVEVDGEEASSPVLARAEAALGAAGGAGAGGPGVMDRVLAAGAAALREVNADRIRAAWKRTLAMLAVATAATLVLLVTHWFLAPIGVRRDGTMAGRWLRGGSAMSKWDVQRVERWAVGAGLSDAVLVNLRAARLDGKALLTLSHEDILKLSDNVDAAMAANMNLQLSAEEESAMWRRTSLDALKLLDARGAEERKPKDFWEFRAQHRQRITLFSTALLYCPRLAILYELVAGPGDLVSNTFSTWYLLLGLAVPEAITVPTMQLLCVHNRVLGLAFLLRVVYRAVVLVAFALDVRGRGLRGALGQWFSVFVLRNWPGALFSAALFLTFPFTPLMLSDVVFYAAVMVWLLLPLLGPVWLDVTRCIVAMVGAVGGR